MDQNEGGEAKKKNFLRKYLIKKYIFLWILAKNKYICPRRKKKNRFPPYMYKKNLHLLKSPPLAPPPPIVFLMVHP